MVCVKTGIMQYLNFHTLCILGLLNIENHAKISFLTINTLEKKRGTLFLNHLYPYT